MFMSIFQAAQGGTKSSALTMFSRTQTTQARASEEPSDRLPAPRGSLRLT